ncbi:MAG: 16S rRNA (cytidine(1402)-2'-O)-methyltransferase [candidate division Zixibacteria bacterium]
MIDFMDNNAMGILYLVPTPIGNMQDITLRALEVLKNVVLVACEDTRRSGQLLAHFGIKAKKISYFEHNEIRRIPKILEILKEGKSVAVISDGGSPGISDPAFRIVKAAIDEGISVEALPGATALIPALTASGLPTDRFFFEGFLPVKKGKRRSRLLEISEYPHTIVIYESVHRIKKTIIEVAEIFAEREVCVIREISKMHEEKILNSAIEVAGIIEKSNPKGEYVIVISGAKHA